jgi:hypothetical protein
MEGGGGLSFFERARIRMQRRSSHDPLSPPTTYVRALQGAAQGFDDLVLVGDLANVFRAAVDGEREG